MPALRALMRRVREQPAEAAAVGAAARARVAARYSQPAVAEQLVRRLAALEPTLVERREQHVALRPEPNRKPKAILQIFDLMPPVRWEVQQITRFGYDIDVPAARQRSGTVRARPQGQPAEPARGGEERTGSWSCQEGSRTCRK